MKLSGDKAVTFWLTKESLLRAKFFNKYGKILPTKNASDEVVLEMHIRRFWQDEEAALLKEMRVIRQKDQVTVARSSVPYRKASDWYLKTYRKKEHAFKNKFVFERYFQEICSQISSELFGVVEESP